MNEQIKLLAEQAGFSVGQIQAEVLCPDHDSPELFRIMDEFNKFPKEVRWHIQDVLESKMEKFAELLVQECAEISEKYAGGSMPLSIAIAIKKHFGVE
jgi:hypothetical protein